ncbi:MAG: patatin family protein [Hyphococcus sp.]|nr:MAG: patatin family protein [Marinicaulis sp.]
MAKKLGLVLGSGAARGWAHVGVLRALNEIGLKPDVIAGCSVGALVGGAHLIGALDEFEAWARELKPLSALERFTLKVDRGGLIDTAPAFKAFRGYDKNIEDLPIKFAAVAADLATGDEIAIRTGSVIDAARASSAIPVVFHAVQHGNRWLVDGALANPAPVSLAREMGADIVVSVDLNAVPRVLQRFDAPPPSVPAVVTEAAPIKSGLTGAVAKLIEDTQISIKRQFDFAKARADAAPHLFETAYASADIFQMHLARARARIDPPDLLLQPDMRDAMPTAFDRADEFIEEGRTALLAQRGKLETLLQL